MQKRKLEMFYFRVAKTWGKSIISTDVDRCRQMYIEEKEKPMRPVSRSDGLQCSHGHSCSEPWMYTG